MKKYEIEWRDFFLPMVADREGNIDWDRIKILLFTWKEFVERALPGNREPFRAHADDVASLEARVSELEQQMDSLRYTSLAQAAVAQQPQKSPPHRNYLKLVEILYVMAPAIQPSDEVERLIGQIRQQANWKMALLREARGMVNRIRDALKTEPNQAYPRILKNIEKWISDYE